MAVVFGVDVGAVFTTLSLVGASQHVGYDFHHVRTWFSVVFCRAFKFFRRLATTRWGAKREGAPPCRRSDQRDRRIRKLFELPYGKD